MRYEDIEGLEPYWYKEDDTDRVWWLEDPATVGEHVFSFDREKRYNLFRDYPHRLSEEELGIFDEENPYWAEFLSDRASNPVLAVVDAVIDILEGMPDGTEATVNECLAELAARDPDAEDLGIEGFSYHGGKVLPVDVQLEVPRLVRLLAGDRGLELDSSPWEHMLLGFPGAIPFVVRRSAAGGQVRDR